MIHIKYEEYIKKTLMYRIIIIISTLKLKELVGQFDSFDFNNQKIYYLKLILVFFHLISVPLSFVGNKNFKILTLFLYLLAIIANNLEWSKEEFFHEIKSYDPETFKKYFYEIGLLFNIPILFDSNENIGKKENKGNKEEKNINDIRQDEHRETTRNQHKKKEDKKKKKRYIYKDIINKKGERENFSQKNKKEISKPDIIKDDENEKINSFNKEDEVEEIKLEISKKESINILSNENEKFKQKEKEYLNEIKKCVEMI